MTRQLLLSLAVLITLSACGTKGDLYLPEEEKTITPQPAPITSERDA